MEKGYDHDNKDFASACGLDGERLEEKLKELKQFLASLDKKSEVVEKLEKEKTFSYRELLFLFVSSLKKTGIEVLKLDFSDRADMLSKIKGVLGKLRDELDREDGEKKGKSRYRDLL